MREQQVAKRHWFTSRSSPSAPTPSGHAAEGATTTSPPTKGRKESNLNPDAKVFRFTRGRSFGFPMRNGNGTSGGQGESIGHPVYGNNVVGANKSRGNGSSASLNNLLNTSSSNLLSSSNSNGLPPPTSSTTSFLSSLLAFTPSAEERAALQRALGHSSMGSINAAWNSSAERLPSDHSPSPNLTHSYPMSQQHSPSASFRGHQPQLSNGSARSSQVDLTGGAAAIGGPIWADLYLPPKHDKHDDPTASSSAVQAPAAAPAAPSSISKRSFSSLWNRKKSNGALGVNVPTVTPMSDDQ